MADPVIRVHDAGIRFRRNRRSRRNFKDLFASTQCEHACRLSSLKVLRELDEVSAKLPEVDSGERNSNSHSDDGHVFYLNEFGF